MKGLFGGGDAMHSEFMAFVTDDISLVAARDWAERQGYPQASIQQSEPEMFVRLLGNSPAPRMALIDIDREGDPAETLREVASMAGSDCRIVVAGSANDVALYRAMLNAGAIDYLVKPLTTAMLNQALIAALRNQGVGKQEKKEAVVATIIGSRGGVGASAIAMNIGWLIAHELGHTAALLDLDLQFGTSALSLDIETGRGLREIASSAHRVDSLMIASSIVEESDKFSVLGAEEAVDETVPMDSGAIPALLKEMKGNYEVIVVDLPRHLLAAQKRLLTLSQDIVIVSDLTLAGIRDTLRIKNAIQALGCEGKVTIVGSRVAAGGGQLDRATFEKGAQTRIDIIVPEDAAAFKAAANNGKAIGAAMPKSAVAQPLRDLARAIARFDAPVVAKPGLWAKLRGLKKPKVARKAKKPS